MKLQVVETNDKDFRDMAALLVDQPLADHDDDAINVDYLCGLAGPRLGAVAHDDDGRAAGSTRTPRRWATTRSRAAVQREGARSCSKRLDSAPKSRGWRMRVARRRPRAVV